MADRSIQALIVEDHPLVRQGVLRLLMDEWPRCSILECGDVQEARRLLDDRDWDFVLLDHHLAGGDGLDLVASVRRPKRILVVSADTSQELMLKAKVLGCGGFVGKNEPPTRFLTAVRAVMEGTLHFPKLDPAAQPVRLSEREEQVRKALVQGRQPFQIAKDLGVTYGSVQTYKKRIFSKLGVSGMVDFLKKAAHLP
jgi:two-component system invasion response regulator UvrY